MEFHYPKISVITPSFNQGDYIERTIKSVLDQQYPNLEFIIIDGGSTDQSVDIIKSYEDRLTYWVSEQDKGTYDANNKALQRITGEYWCIVNSDDVLLPGALQTVATYVNAHPDTYWFAGSVNLIDESDAVTLYYTPEPPKEINGYTFLNRCWILHPGVFLHRDIIQRIGLFSKYHSMDYDYWLKMEKAGYKPFLIKETLAGLRMHAHCKSSDTVRAHKECLLVFDNFVAENNLQEIAEVQKIRKLQNLYIVQAGIEEQLKEGKAGELRSLLKTGWQITPAVLFKGWYVKGLIQIFTGVKKKVEKTASEANWNDLNE